MTSSPYEHHWCMHAALSPTRLVDKFDDLFYSYLYIRDPAWVQSEPLHLRLHTLHFERDACGRDHDVMTGRSLARYTKLESIYSKSEAIESRAYLDQGAKSLVSLPWSAKYEALRFFSTHLGTSMSSNRYPREWTELRSSSIELFSFHRARHSLETYEW